MMTTEQTILWAECAAEMDGIPEVKEMFLKCAAALRRTAEDDKAREEGTWQNVYLSSPSSFVGTCSVCGMSNDIPPPILAHYCPNCGTGMNGQEAALEVQE